METKKQTSAEEIYENISSDIIATSKETALDLIKKHSDYTIFTSKEDIVFILSDSTFQWRGKKFYINHLKRILSDDEYYQKTLNYLSGKVEFFQLAYIVYDDLSTHFSLGRTDIVNGLERLINKDVVDNLGFPIEDEFTNEQIEKFYVLKDSISFKKLKEKYANQVYNISIEGSEYKISIGSIFNFIELSDEKFFEYLEKNNITEINGIPKKYFLYAVHKLFDEKKLFFDFLIPEKIIKRLRDIRVSKYIDIEAINKFLTIEETDYQKVEIDEEVKNKILSNMPADLTKLEKAIYVYIKMCKIFQYDDEFYAMNQKGPIKEKHQNINYINKLSLDNNKLVCYEFNLIYSKILAELGINFAYEYEGGLEASYGTAHPYLRFRVDDYLIKADAVKSIFHGDLTKAKLNQIVEGIYSYNLNEKTQLEFDKILRKVSEIVFSEEQELGEIKKDPTIGELVQEYIGTTTNIRPLDLKEKVSILFTKIKNSNIGVIDSLSYILQLKNILFSRYELRDNIEISIIKEIKENDNERIATASCILALNEKGFIDNEEDTIYYYFHTNEELKIISKEELEMKFANKTFEYVNEWDPKVPGIQNGVKR